MLQPLSDDDRRSFRSMLAPPLRDAVREAARLDDPAELELFAGGLLPSLLLSTMPGAVEEAVAVIAEAPAGLSLLRGIEAAAPPRLSRLAAEASSRLGEGPTSVAATQVGTLAPVRAWEVDAGEPVSSLLVECRRPGAERSQMLCFTIERSLTDGAVKDGFVSAPVATGDVEETFLGVFRRQGIEPVELDPASALELVAEGAVRSAACGYGPSRGALLAATLLLRGACRADAEELLEPLVGLPSIVDLLGDLDESGSDEEALRAEIGELVDELGDWCERQGWDEERRDLVVYAGGCMADFRAFYLDGDVAGWDAPDLRAFLLDFVPRKVGLEPRDVECFPEAVAEVLRFLGESGELELGRARRLEKLALAAREEFAVEASDPAKWGLAKGMAGAMSAAGVDLTDEDAVQTWIDSFNARPREEREQLVPALTSLPLPGRGGGAGKRKAAAKTRKAARRARRRNRRR